MTRVGVQSAVDGVIALDERGTIHSFNPAAERIFGYGAGEIIGENVRVLVPATEYEENRAKLADYLRPGGNRFTGVAWEIRARRKNGTLFPLDLHVSEFDDTAGRRFVGTVRDVTERKLAEEQVRRRQAELAHVLRVATVERLAAGLAHELNQPLSAIANDVEACATHVRSGKREPKRLLALLESAGAEALRAGEIVHHLRMFVQRAEPRFEVMDIGEVVRHGIHWLAREMEHERISLQLEIAPPLLVRLDHVQIEQVLVNLLQNAIDAIVQAGGETREIRVRVSPGPEATAEVMVEDTGTGLTAGATERLYEPFFTTKAKGMGLGLAICRTIVEMHHGRLSVGPRASGPGHHGVPGPAARWRPRCWRAAGMTARPTVFVVDDNAGVRTSLQALFEAAGLRVVTFASSTEFLAAFDAGRPGCLILDVRLRGDSGLDLQDELRRRGAMLPIIVMTGYADVATSVRALKGGAVDFLRKPVPPKQLVERVRGAIEVDRIARQLAERRSDVTDCIARLTAREREVMDLMAVGNSSKEIAVSLKISVRTVEGHRRVVLRKMGVASAAQLARSVARLDRD